LIELEKKYNERFGGVIIRSFVRGRKVALGDEAGYRESTPLLYGYKCGDQYDFKSTRRAGWERFETWKEDFGFGFGLDYWVNWLPEEVIGEIVQTLIIPRDEAKMQAKREQARSIEEHISLTQRSPADSLDSDYPQNEQSCPGCPYMQKCFPG